MNPELQEFLIKIEKLKKFFEAMEDLHQDNKVKNEKINIDGHY